MCTVRLMQEFFKNFDLLTRSRVWNAVGRRKRSVLTKDMIKQREQFQEIIENNVAEDRIKSNQLIGKVNSLIESGKCGRLFAIVDLGGFQHRITAEDVLLVEHYWPPNVGDKIVLEKVLLVGSPYFTLIGRPILPQNLIRVHATIIHKDLTHTQMRYHFIHKEGVHKLNFDRSEYTYMRINEIHISPKLNILEHTEFDRC